ncbi:MAG: response regulator [Clostridiaceae bacterium]|nr:response regulator [Clostridiaceae bacterium]
MIKVLIVDDDNIARTNINILIDWEKNGYEICAEAMNGEEAIQLISETRPQIVITDMSMPVMDGITLIDHLSKNHPQIKVVVLSGYQEFDYVRKSMKYGAVDYVLKHTLNAQVLLEILNTARDKLMEELSEQSRKIMLEEQIKESKTLLRQKFISELVQGAVSDRDEIMRKIADLKLEIESKGLAVILFEIDDYNAICGKFTSIEINKLISSVESISAEILKGGVKAVVSHLQDGMFTVVVSFGNIRSELFTYNFIITTISRIRSSIKRYLNITACFSYSKTFNDIADIHKYFTEAEIALQDRFFRGKDQIIDKTRCAGLYNEYISLELAEEKSIIEALKARDHKRIEECLSKVFSKIIVNKLGYNSVQMICAELINIVNRVARETGIEIKRVYSDKDIPYDSMRKMETLLEMREWILRSYTRLADMIGEVKANENYSVYTKKAISYIQKNYTKNVSLNEAAEHIGINSSYLSRVFKEDCGMGFVEYLNNVRVSYAKQLIETEGLRLKDVAKRVGFNNYTYFFKVFKDVLNVTPGARHDD